MPGRRIRFLTAIMKMKILFATAMAIMIVACNSVRVDSPVRYGEISVAIAGEPDVEVVTKAPETLDPESDEAGKYIVRIFNSSGAMQYEAGYDVFEAQRLPLGTYYVTAENCTEAQAEAGNGRMRLYGRSQNVTLSPEQLSQTATVGCTVANAKVSVVFDSSVEGLFTDLKVVLSGGTTPGRSITVTETASDVVTETWFNPSNLTYEISGTFDQTGKEIGMSRAIELHARNNLMLVVKVSLENGQLLPSVTVDTQIDDPTVESGSFNPYE